MFSLAAVHKENESRYVLSAYTPRSLMDRKEIRKAVAELTDRFSLLVLLNRVKSDELGDKAYPFTISQLNYFCHPGRNAGHYTSFAIPKKSGKLREISAPQAMLKSMLTYMNVILQAMYEPTEAAMGFVPGRSVVDNARKHVGMNYVLNLDLENFFPSIPQARVWGALQSKAVGFNRGIASAVAGLCCTEMTFFEGRPVLMTKELPKDAVTEKRNVLPQGAPTSPILTNIVCRNLDRKLSRLARHYGLNYTRYADDITFSSHHNVYQKDGEFMRALHETIASENFSVNAAKTRLQVKGRRQEVTGLVVNEVVNVTRDYVRSIGSLLYIWERHGYDAAYSKFLVHYRPKAGRRTAPSMERVLQGKIMYLLMVKGDDSPAVKRLLLRFNTLVAAKEEKKADINYIASYKVRAFEKRFSTAVEFKVSEEDAKGEHWKTLLASCTINGQDTRISVSDPCKELIEGALQSADANQIEILKNKFYVALCQRYGDPFWMIMKSRPRAVYAKSRMIPDGPDMTTEGLAASEILAQLVESDFDLNVLDQW